MKHEFWKEQNIKYEKVSKELCNIIQSQLYLLFSTIEHVALCHRLGDVAYYFVYTYK